MKYKMFFITLLCLHSLFLSGASAAKSGRIPYQSLPLYGHYGEPYDFLTLFTSQFFGNLDQTRLQELGTKFVRNQLCATNPFTAFTPQSFAITIHGSHNADNALVPTPWNICWHHWRFGSQNNISAQVLMGLFEPVGLGAALDLPFNALASLSVHPHNQDLSPNNARFIPQPDREIISFFAAAQAPEDNRSTLVFTLIINNPVLQKALLDQKITAASLPYYSQPFSSWLALLQQYIPQLTNDADKKALADAIEILRLSSESFYEIMPPAQPWQAFTPADALALTPEELAWIATSAAPAPTSSQKVASSAQLGATAQPNALTDEQLAKLLAEGAFGFNEEPDFPATTDQTVINFFTSLLRIPASQPAAPAAASAPRAPMPSSRQPSRSATQAKVQANLDLSTLRRDLPAALQRIPTQQQTTLDVPVFGQTTPSAYVPAQTLLPLPRRQPPARPAYTPSAASSTSPERTLPKQNTTEKIFELSQELRAWLDRIPFSSENEILIKQSLNQRKKPEALKTEIDENILNIIKYIKNKSKS